MPKGYRRNFFAVEASIVDHRKWAALSWAERGKWLAVRALAERQLEVGGFESRGHLEHLLHKEGDRSPAATVDKLIAIGWLDAEPDGSIVVHDHDDYRPHLSTARVRQHRQSSVKRDETFHAVPQATEQNTTDRTDRTDSARPRANGHGSETRGSTEPSSIRDLLPPPPGYPGRESH